MRIKLILIGLCGLILFHGCQPISTENGTQLEETLIPAPVSPSQGNIIMTPSLPVPSDPGLQSLVQRTKEDLANRLVIPADEISFVEITEVEWSDSSLGCPQPGMNYLQVITPGYLILLEANTQMYEYHSNRDTFFILCENSSPPSIPKP